LGISNCFVVFALTGEQTDGRTDGRGTVSITRPPGASEVGGRTARRFVYVTAVPVLRWCGLMGVLERELIAFCLGSVCTWTTP